MSLPDAPDTRRARREARRKRAQRITVTGVLGELLLTAGLGTLAFMGWKYWLNDVIQGNEQNSAGGELSQQFEEEYESAEPFAVLYVPAFGKDYSRTIATDITQYGVLDHYVGYYMESDAPGAVGTFAVAGHRLAYGAPMQNIPNLQVGDHAYVETVDGWYEYEYRSGEYVDPYEVSILSDVPRYPDETSSDRILLMMTCNPIYSVAERVVSYSVFVDFTPRSEGAPDEIADVVNERTANDGQDTGRE
jgi:sortase A